MQPTQVNGNLAFKNANGDIQVICHDRESAEKTIKSLGFPSVEAFQEAHTAENVVIEPSLVTIEGTSAVNRAARRATMGWKNWRAR